MGASGRVDAREPGETLRLRLLRWPDLSPVHPRSVDVQRAGVPVQVASEGAGRFALARPIGTEALVLEVPRYEPERIESERWQNVEELEVRLRPVEGLFGRVVESDGRPAAGVPVVAMRAELGAEVEFHEGSPPRVRMSEGLRGVAVDVTDAQGRYVLDVPTRSAAAPLSVRAVGGARRFAELAVELPRSNGPLEDLVLGAPPGVYVRVQDERGAPIEGVVLGSSLPRLMLVDAQGGYALRTDSDGLGSVPVWQLPVDIRPMARGWQPVAKRIDGLEVSPEEPLERLDQTLEWTMRRAAFVDVSVVDARTGAAVQHERVYLVPELAGRPVASLELLAMAMDGSNSYGFWDDSAPEFFAEEAPEYDTIQARLNEHGYEPVHRSVSRAELPPGASLVLELEPVTTARYVGGRVLDGGKPVAGANVWVRGISPGSQASRVGVGQAEGETDSEGRFSLLWNPLDPAERVAVEVRDPMRERIAHAGPMSPDDAVDLTLEFEATVDVPVFLVGASEGKTYSILVEVESGDEHRPWWIAKVPARSLGRGALGGLIALPERSPVRLSLRGPLADPGPERTVSEVRFDPTSSAASISFDVARPQASLRGRVQLPPGADPKAHRVVVASDAAGRATFASVLDSRGGFGFDALPLGNWELILVRAEARSNAPVVGRRKVELSEDLDGVVLVASD